MDILNLLGGNNLIEGITEKTGISKDQVNAVVQNALPTLMGAVAKNSQNEQTASGLLGALQSDKHDGSLLDNLSGLFSGDTSALTKDGAGILGHLFGGNQEAVQAGISAKTGVSASGVSQIMEMLSPMLMSFLGKKVSDQNVTSPSGLGSILGSLTGGAGGGFLSFLDADKDGSIIDDLSEKFLGKDNPLGGLFGGK